MPDLLTADLILRRTVSAVIPLTAIVLWTASADAYQPPKLSVLVLLAGMAVGRWLRQAIVHGRVPTPPRVFSIAVGAVLGTMLLATLLSLDPALSLVGVRARFGGLLGYGSAMAIAMVVAATSTRETARSVLHGMLGGSVVVLGIGLLQGVGIEPLAGRQASAGVSTTLGNSNFASAWAGAVTAPAAWLIASAGRSQARRFGGLALLVGALAMIVSTRALQGLPTAAAALTPLIIVWAGRLAPVRRRLVRASWLAALGLGGAAVIVGVLGNGPLASLASETGVRLRGYYWRAALEIAGGSPVTGTGLDTYGRLFRQNREPGAAALVDLTTGNDAAHSVPLHFLAGGGVLLLLAWLALAVVVGWALTMGLRRAEGEGKTLLAAVGGLWVAYQVQSLVSIDVPPLMALHAASAGLVVALSGMPRGILSLPWALDETPKSVGRPGKRKSKASQKPEPVPAHRGPLGTTVFAIVVLVALVLGVQPLRANLAARSAAVARAGNRAAEYVDRSDRAAALAFWEETYAHEAGVALQRTGRPDDALARYEEIDAEAPGLFETALSAARMLAEDEPAPAAEWYERALELEPHHPDMLVDAATFFAEQGDTERARALIEQALASDPNDAGARAALDELG